MIRFLGMVNAFLAMTLISAISQAGQTLDQAKIINFLESNEVVVSSVNYAQNWLKKGQGFKKCNPWDIKSLKWAMERSEDAAMVAKAKDVSPTAFVAVRVCDSGKDAYIMIQVIGDDQPGETDLQRVEFGFGG